jgi:hypothetical protein
MKATGAEEEDRQDGVGRVGGCPHLPEVHDGGRPGRHIRNKANVVATDHVEAIMPCLHPVSGATRCP